MSDGRVALRRWRPEDRGAFIRLAEDPEILEWTGRTAKTDELFDYYLKLDSSFAVTMNDEVIGAVSLFENSMTRSVRALKLYEIAFYLFPKDQGAGLGREAVHMAIIAAGERFGADAVIAGTSVENDRARHLIEREGGRYCFSREGASFTEAFYVIPVGREALRHG